MKTLPIPIGRGLSVLSLPFNVKKPIKPVDQGKRKIGLKSSLLGKPCQTFLSGRSPREKGVGIIPSECKDDAIQETVDDASLVWIGL
jgi:hypothetical protein